MIEYLKNYSISLEEWDLIEAGLDKELLLNFKVMENNVCEVISYFHEIGVQKLANIIIYRPDLCFKTRKRENFLLFYLLLRSSTT